MPASIDLEYGSYGGYNRPDLNERKAELPIAFWFISEHGDDLIEIGEVTDFYVPAKHVVYDLTTERASTTKMDARQVDYCNKNVLSISSIEHIGFGDYGLPAEPHAAIRVLERITKDSKNHLCTWPVGYNAELDSDLMGSGIPYSVLERDAENRWQAVDHGDLSLYRYDHPHPYGNAIVVVTNLDIRFRFT